MENSKIKKCSEMINLSTIYTMAGVGAILALAGYGVLDIQRIPIQEKKAQI